MSYEVFAGPENAYRILLGDAVVSDIKDLAGNEGLTKFLKLHSKYDALTRKSPKTDPIHVIHSEIPVFDSAEDYAKFLHGIEKQLAIMKAPIARAMHECVTQMLAVLDTKKQVKTATSSSHVPVFGKRVFKRRLPAVPVLDIAALPSSYPNWDATLAVVDKYFAEKGLASAIKTDLTTILKAGLVAVVESEMRDNKEPNLKSLVAEAQEYLMSRNWLDYGIHNVAYASHSLAVAGIRHSVTTQGQIRHIGVDRTLAYTHLGANLEAYLRRAVFGCIRDLVADSHFPGYTAATDVLVSACSYRVQELGRQWLENVLLNIKGA